MIGSINSPLPISFLPTLIVRNWGRLNSEQ